MRKFLLASSIAAVSVLATTAVSAREDSGKRFTVSLQGEAEVPKLGDLDGTGRATIRINPGRRQLCYTLRVSGIAPAAAAHIHEAPAGKAGDVVFPLAAPTDGSSEGCFTITREQAMEIIRNPDDYYVNVHNAEFPGGALRGQLK
jgi:hypothetical protein